MIVIDYLTYNGVTKTIDEWASCTGLTVRTIKRRLNKGLSIHDVLTLKPHYRNYGLSKFTGTRLYRIFTNMKTRCYNTKAHNYKYYGGRGVKICDEWLNDRNAFYEWAIANGYTDDLTIDRIDVNGNYEPSNCRWVDMHAQMMNNTNAVVLSAFGETKPLRYWAKKYTISASTIMRRIYKGVDVETAITTPSDTRCEKSIENDFRKYLNGLGVFPIGLTKQKLDRKRIGYHRKIFNGGSIGVIKGIPDMEVMINNTYMRFESKQHNGVLSIHQKRIIRELLDISNYVYILDDVTISDCKALCNALVDNDWLRFDECSDNLIEYTRRLIDDM